MLIDGLLGVIDGIVESIAGREASWEIWYNYSVSMFGITWRDCNYKFHNRLSERVL